MQAPAAAGVGVHVGDAQSAAGRGRAGADRAVVEMTGFGDGAQGGRSGVAHLRHIVGAMDGDGEGLYGRCAGIVGDGQAKSVIDRACERIDGDRVWHVQITAGLRVQEQGATAGHLAQVKAASAAVCHTAGDAVAGRVCAISVARGQGTRYALENVSGRCVLVAGGGDAGTEDGRVVGGGDGHLQGLGGAAGAVAHTHTEDLAGIGLQGFNGGIVRYVHISAVAAVQVQRAIAAGQAGGVGDAADALAATGLTGHAVGQHGVVVCVASCKRARDIGKSIVGTGVAQGDGGRCSQGRPIVGAGDGDGDGGVVAQSRAAGVCGADGVGQHQGFAGGQVVKVLGTAVEGPAHTGRGAAGVAEQAGGGQAQHGQKIGVAGVGGCRGAANGQGFTHAHGIAQVTVRDSNISRGAQRGVGL